MGNFILAIPRVNLAIVFTKSLQIEAKKHLHRFGAYARVFSALKLYENSGNEVRIFAS